MCIRYSDDTTVEFQINRPYSIWPYTMAIAGIVPEHAYGPDYGEHPIGSGRYLLKQWDKAVSYTHLDEAICIGPAASSQSYLNMERILTATVAMKADAIHPGFGFLSENARFAELCEKCNITFIGPSADIINKMGNKSEARKTMMEAGVPVVPGGKEPVYTVEEAKAMAQEVGYPVMIKASSGGGGKGMRISYSCLLYTSRCV